jgi:site-specific DNA-methyltransferase (adenine-specific)
MTELQLSTSSQVVQPSPIPPPGLLRRVDKVQRMWTIATQPFRGSHTATFPVKLVEPCILAGTSAAGCCSRCGRPWRRELEVTYQAIAPDAENRPRRHADPRVFEIRVPRVREARTLGWQPTCDCGAPTVPATVLDPFAGTGTTLLVAQQQGRHAVGAELNRAYLGLIKERLSQPSRSDPGAGNGDREAA